MAIAIKMAMINTTTINSMRVKPCSSSRRREASVWRKRTLHEPLSCAGGVYVPRDLTQGNHRHASAEP